MKLESHLCIKCTVWQFKSQLTGPSQLKRSSPHLWFYMTKEDLWRKCPWRKTVSNQNVALQKQNHKSSQIFFPCRDYFEDCTNTTLSFASINKKQKYLQWEKRCSVIWEDKHNQIMDDIPSILVRSLQSVKYSF